MFFQSVGVIGSILVLYSYLGVSFHFMTAQQYRYYVINSIAAILLLISLYNTPNLGSIIIETFLLAISIVGFIKLRYFKS